MNRAAFSLVELSIVLVILGLLVGGILAGQSLIRSSELRAVGTEYDRYIAATYAFRDKYLGLPGDISNAVSFWGQATNCPGSNTQGSTDARTCNGDSDGIIENNPGSGFGNEYFRYWHHLANAGLIGGSFSGVRGVDSSIHSVAGFNVPRSKLSRACWSINGDDTATSGSSSVFDMSPGNRAILGQDSSSGSCKEGVLHGAEIWNIDTKLDDGKPATGRVRPFYRQECSIGSGSADVNAVYRLNAPERECSVFFINPF